MEELVLVKKSDLRDLLADVFKLQALYDAGVDNWSGSSDILDPDMVGYNYIEKEASFIAEEIEKLITDAEQEE